MENKEYSVEEVKDLINTENILANMLDRYDLLLSKFEKIEERMEKLDSSLEKLSSILEKNLRDLAAFKKMIVPDSANGNLTGVLQNMIDSMEDDICEALEEVGGSIAIKAVDEMEKRELIKKDKE